MKHEISVQRHQLKVRKLQVARKEYLSRDMLRIYFRSDELKDFTSMSSDDHIKMFFPDPVTGELTKPVPPGPGGPGSNDGKSRQDLMRDYTPQAFDNEKCELTVDFFLHGKGVGSDWALHSRLGDEVYIGGPRGSHIVSYDFDWYLMIGEECAIPSFERRLRELPASSRVIVLIEVENLVNQREIFTGRENTTIKWVKKSLEKDQIANILRESSLPGGEFYTWIALESSRAQEIKDLMLNIKGASSEWIKASGYWRKMGTEHAT